jgi:hypothetical protein
MKILERVKQLLSEPTYRTKLAFFVLMGVVVSLLAILVNDPWKSFFQDFAVVFITVAVIQFLWDFLGGEPMELKIQEVQKEVVRVNQSLAQEIVRVNQSLTLLKDLGDGNIGLERIWPNRESWQSDPHDGLRSWYERVSQAKQVEIVSNTLWNNWMKRDSFRKELFDNLTKGASARILIYDPESEVLKLRAADEKDTYKKDLHGQAHFQMQDEINATLVRLAEGWKNLNESGKKNLQLRLTHQSMHFVQMIRADEWMLVTLYLSGKSGTPSPIMQFRDSGSTYFVKYTEQFRTLWERARPVDEAYFNRILQETEDSSSPSVES